ncbi:MAG: nucleoside-diphosphate kinase, partial [Actinomycetota bacterium]|nr:nucleoside-diphosphate kinase [Actinomycetota bacterium]
VAFITRGPSLLMVVEGPLDTYSLVRTMMGATDPREAAPGSIRGDLANTTTENLVHGSDSAESAAREIALFFPDLVPASSPLL